MRKLKITYLLILITSISFSQETKIDTLKTEEISVVKPYTPKISDAFKVKSTPVTNASKSFQKEQINYRFFSIPVASTFMPTKGKAKGVVKAPKERLYENYVMASYGNYVTPIFEAFVHTGDERYNDFGILLNYHSSKGNIPDLLLNDNFSNTAIDLYYKQFERDFDWKVKGGYKRDLYNYYGLPTNVTYNQNVIDAIDEKQIYNTFYLAGDINYDDSIFQEAKAELSGFIDDYNSTEIRFIAQPKFNYPIADNNINGDFLIDFLTGKFDENYTIANKIKYSFLNLGLSPNFNLLNENTNVNIGAKIYYTFDLENSTNSFKIYPNITASYKIIDNIFILLAGVTGDLVQNTYKDFAAENPFISPTINIKQTDNQYNAFIGAKGKLASNIGYNFKASYQSEKDKALYIQNQTQTDGTIIVNNAYEAGNSFGVVYDHLKTINIYGELNFEISKAFQITANANYSNYTNNVQLEAWNLPEIKAFISAEYRIKNWFVGTKIFFNGKTKDYVIPFGESPDNGVIIKNKSYLDLNFNGGYTFSNRLSVFAKINNAIGNNYQRFVNYPMQSFQVLGGVLYKFDI